MRVEIGSCRVGVDQDDGLAELREVDREALGDDALAHAAAPPAHRDEPAPSARGGARVVVFLLEGRRGRLEVVGHGAAS